MQSYRLPIFVLKRVIICAAVLSALGIALLDSKWYAVLGIWVGALLGVLRLVSNNRLFIEISRDGTPAKVLKKCLLLYAAGVLAVIAVMIASAAVDRWLFAGVITGLLLSVFVIIINIFTEFLGFTHNNFE